MWNSADAIGSLANGTELCRGDSAAVAADTTGIAHVLGVSELSGSRKVQGSECSRFSEHMPIFMLERFLSTDEDATYGLGIGASSSNALTVGAYAGTIGEYGRLSPRGLSDLPATRSRYVGGGANSMEPIMENESSLSLEGVGKVFKGAGGGSGRLGPPGGPMRPEADE